ncbi:hypothetical protein PQG02_28235 [Nostoc sp. UHCC 0926]|uniref:hypothetical protein n=1 Tax=Nostoc sp. TaxID=1180 RepID=UPI0027A17748|nr:hypothetical protein PQG02_28235 [Nostoc sp. UHCC 0926]
MVLIWYWGSILLLSAVTLIADFELLIASKIASSEDAKEGVVLSEMSGMVN